MKKELMRRIVNVTKNKIISEEIIDERNIYLMSVDIITSFGVDKHRYKKYPGYKEYNSNCFEYINSDRELILEYIMWFIV